MLGMGLMMESHLAEVKKRLDGPVIFGNKRRAAIDSLGELERDCYVCNRIDCSFPRQTIQHHGNPSLCPNQ